MQNAVGISDLIQSQHLTAKGHGSAKQLIPKRLIREVHAESDNSQRNLRARVVDAIPQNLRLARIGRLALCIRRPRGVNHDPITRFHPGINLGDSLPEDIRLSHRRTQCDGRQCFARLRIERGLCQTRTNLPGELRPHS